MIVVIDASLIGPLVIEDERSELTTAITAAIVSEILLVPSHWRLEVANMIQTAIRRGRVDSQERPAIFASLMALQIEVDPLTWAAAWSDTLDLAEQHALTPYDAAYLELARRTGATLATLDRALARATRAEAVPLMEWTT